MKLQKISYKPKGSLVKNGEPINVKGRIVQSYSRGDEGEAADWFEHDETNDVWYKLIGQ